MDKTLYDIRRLLLVIAIPVILYVFHILSAIFIPLFFGFFSALLFAPILRWFIARKLPKFIGVIFIFMLVGLMCLGVYQIFLLVGSELSAVDTNFIDKMNTRFIEITNPITAYFGIDFSNLHNSVLNFLQNDEIVKKLFGNLTLGIGILSKIITTIALSLFFMLLLLIDSVNIQEVFQVFLYKNDKATSRKAYLDTEKVIFKFILVKTFISLLTGFGFTLLCYIFDVSFPIFWGVAAFFLNFIQFVGPILSIVAIAIFGVIELNLSGTLILFIILSIAVHVLTGGITEPILMGKSFSINTVTILIMFALWGIIWGIPGMILSIPITVLFKMVLEKNPGMYKYAKLMS